jgi:hypothetical protein
MTSLGKHWKTGPPSEQHRKKISESKKGIPLIKNRNECNGMWKGDNVGKWALHIWVRKRLPIPKLCQICNKTPPYDLANITGIYNRELQNWKYLCRKCHMESDGRLDRIHFSRPCKLKGVPRSEGTKRKISESRKKYYQGRMMS